jgi:hypothetical protein
MTSGFNLESCSNQLSKLVTSKILKDFWLTLDWLLTDSWPNPEGLLTNSWQTPDCPQLTPNRLTLNPTTYQQNPDIRFQFGELFKSALQIGYLQNQKRLLTDSWRTPDGLLTDSWRTPDGLLTDSWRTPDGLLTDSWPPLLWIVSTNGLSN